MDESEMGFIQIDNLALQRIREYAQLLHVRDAGLRMAIEDLRQMAPSHPHCGDLADELQDRMDFPERYF
jgi:hypothetical protein